MWRFTSKGKKENTRYREDDDALRKWKTIKWRWPNRKWKKNKNINTKEHGVMEMEEKMKDKKLMKMEMEWARYLECRDSPMSDESRHLKIFHSHKIRPKLRGHKSHSQFVHIFFSFSNFNVWIHGVRHHIYRNGCLGKQDDGGYDGKKIWGVQRGWLRSKPPLC